MSATSASNNGINGDGPGPEVRRSGSSEVVERGLDVLLCFLEAEGDLGVSEIARRLGIDKGRVHRFLMALKRKGFVTDNPRTRRYSLGFRVLELSNALSRQFDVAAQALPFLRELRDATLETSTIAAPVGGHRIHLAQVESLEEIRQTFVTGKPLPIYAGAMGRVLLAFMPAEERERLLALRLEAFTEDTITDVDRLRGDLIQVCHQGYAMSMGERMPGARSIAAPVWSWRGDVVAINVSGPAFRFTVDRANAAVGLLLDVAARLTRQLGGEPFATSLRSSGLP
ncbi:MAG: IclR family transcriptional regulator [Bacteroidetes bacterium]|nr:IclR family transcriptional regulator [Bacteroidota bacterium]